jgi:2-dehydropantoate 2-reductase
MPVEIVADVQRALWEKAMANLVINPLGALARVRNGAVGTEERFQNTARDILKETTAVATSEGVRIDLDEAYQIFRTTAAATAENENSMLRDIQCGKPTEIAHLNGHVVRKGKEKGIPVPTNESLVEQIETLHPAHKS